MKALEKTLFLFILLTYVGCQSNEETATSQTLILDSPQWELVWSDEFNYDGSPDPSKWNYEKGFIRNDELQYYTDRSENIRVNGSHLIIEARQDSAVVDGEMREITAASITTRGKQAWQYGKVDISAKLPNGLGTWPALWMLGENFEEIGWPRCGEIDIMENVGYSPDTVFTTIHTEAYNHTHGTNKDQRDLFA